MKTVFTMILAMILLAGCGGMNTITTQQLDGSIKTEKMSDDAMYYQALAGMKSKIDCGSYTFEQCGLLVAIAGLVDVARGYPARGMNGYELAAKLGGDVVSLSPAVVGIFGMRYLAKTPNAVNFNGDGNAYITNDFVGSGNSASIPSFSPPSTTTTTYVPVTP